MTWWRRWWRREQMESELERELRFHEDESVADLVARGVHPDEARRQARLALGGREQLKEQCRDARGTRWVEDSRAGRALRRSYAAADAGLRGRRHPRACRRHRGDERHVHRSQQRSLEAALLSGTGTSADGAWRNCGARRVLGILEPRFRRPRTRDSFACARCVDLWRRHRQRSRRPRVRRWTARFSADLLSLLGIPVLHGRTFRPDDDRQGASAVAIISHGLWQRRFGGRLDAVGQRLVYDGQPYTIVGIASERFELAGHVDICTPLGQNVTARMQNRQARFIHVVARLRPGATPAQAQAELDVVARRLAQEYPGTNEGVDMRARPLQQELVGNVGSTLWLLLAAVGLVLLIACVNIASLLLARAASREREFAMRAALGASRGRLIRQCLSESTVLGVSGGALGAFLAAVGVGPFVAMWPGSLPRAGDIRFDASVWLFTFILSLASSVLFGLAPALRIRIDSVERALRAGARSIAAPSPALQRGYVIAEVALAVVLLVSAGMVGRTLLALSSLDPGMNVRNVLTAARRAVAGRVETRPDPLSVAAVLDRRAVSPMSSRSLADIIPMRQANTPRPTGPRRRRRR